MYNCIGNSFVFSKVGFIIELFYDLLYSVEECPRTQKPSPAYKRRRPTKKYPQPHHQLQSQTKTDIPTHPLNPIQP